MAQKPRKLECPYTRLAQEIVFIDDLRRPGWTIMGGFDPSLPFLDEEVAKAAFRRRGGIGGVAPVPSCAYTGARVTFVKRKGLWWAEGNFFRPYDAFKDRAELEWWASMRNGKTRAQRPERPRVVSVESREQHSNPALGLGGGGEITSLVGELLK